MPAVWLVSWQERVRDGLLNDDGGIEKTGKSVYVNRESCNEAFVPLAGVDDAALQRECKGPHCYGALELRPKYRAHVLQHLAPDEREQTRFWSRLLPYLDMYDVLYFFEVTRRAPLQAPDPVLQSCIGHQRGPVGHWRGSVLELVGGTAERLSRENPAAADIMAGSHLAVRVPTLHARLLLRGDWTSLALIYDETLGRNCPWRCDFASLGVSPVPFPRVAVNQDGLPPEPTFSPADALQLADALRKIFCGAEVGADEALAWVQKLQAIHDQGDEFAGMAQLKDAAGFALASSLARSRGSKFQAMALLQVLLMSAALRDDAGLASVIETAIALLVPNVLLKTVKECFGKHLETTNRMDRWLREAGVGLALAKGLTK